MNRRSLSKALGEARSLAMEMLDHRFILVDLDCGERYVRAVSLRDLRLILVSFLVEEEGSRQRFQAHREGLTRS